MASKLASKLCFNCDIPIFQPISEYVWYTTWYHETKYHSRIMKYININISEFTWIPWNTSVRMEVSWNFQWNSMLTSNLIEFHRTLLYSGKFSVHPPYRNELHTNCKLYHVFLLGKQNTWTWSSTSNILQGHGCVSHHCSCCNVNYITILFCISVYKLYINVLYIFKWISTLSSWHLLLAGFQVK